MALCDFFSLMNICGINSQTLYSFANQKDKKLHRRLFLKNLALSFMKEHLTFRASLQNLPSNVQAFLKKNYGMPKERGVREEQQAPKHGTCCSCARDRKNISINEMQQLSDIYKYCVY